MRIKLAAIAVTIGVVTPAAAQDGHSLSLSGPAAATVGKPAMLTATGVVPADVTLNRYVNVYAIPTSVLATCPETLQGAIQVSYASADQGGDTVANTVPAEGAFSLPIAYNAKAAGQMLLCGYLHEGVETMATAAHAIAVAAAAAKPANLKAPKVSRKGNKLVCSTGRWSGKPTAFAFHWRRDGKRIKGASKKTLALTSKLRGHTVTCGVRAKNAEGAATARSGNGVRVS